MTKSQLINALIDQTDLEELLSSLLRSHEELLLKNGMAEDKMFYEDLVVRTQDVLKELEDGDQLVYIATSESGGKHKGTRLMRVGWATHEDGPDEAILII